MIWPRHTATRPAINDQGNTGTAIQCPACGYWYATIHADITYRQGGGEGGMEDHVHIIDCPRCDAAPTLTR